MKLSVYRINEAGEEVVLPKTIDVEDGVIVMNQKQEDIYHHLLFKKGTDLNNILLDDCMTAVVNYGSDPLNRSTLVVSEDSDSDIADMISSLILQRTTELKFGSSFDLHIAPVVKIDTYLNIVDRTINGELLETIVPDDDPISIDKDIFAVIDSEADKRYFGVSSLMPYGIVELEFKEPKYDPDDEEDMVTYNTLSEEEQNTDDLIGEVVVIVEEIDSQEYIEEHFRLEGFKLIPNFSNDTIYEYTINQLISNTPLAVIYQPE